jgi:cell wall-associated NlpC family hydrolase
LVFFDAHPGRVFSGATRPARHHGVLTALRRLAIMLATGATLLGFFAADPAGEAVAASYATGSRTLDKAETQRGCWYGYGHAGPCAYGFDCSGLVYWSAHRLGVNLPRSTQAIMSSRLVYRIPLSSARRGDLMFYGPNHVEINTAWSHTTFGALHTGTRIGWHKWSAYWHPTMAYRLR